MITPAVNTHPLRGKRILQVVPQMDVGGVEQTTSEICAGLNQAGAIPWIATSGGKMLEDLDCQVAQMPLHSKNPFTIHKNAQRLESLIKEHQIDLVHARSRAPAWSALHACQRSKTPLVTTFHGIYNFSDTVLGHLKKRYNSVMMQGDVVIANSEFTARHIIETYGQPKKLRIIPRGVDVHRFDPKILSSAQIHDLRSRWEYRESFGPLILLPGRLTPWKGELLFLRALLELKDLPYYAIIMGAPQKKTGYVQQLRDFIEKHKLSDRVHLDLVPEDMPLALGAADLVLSASEEPEAFGRILAEAMAMERPVLAPAHGGATEILGQSPAGSLFAPKDPVSLAQGLRGLLTVSPQSRQHMGQQGRARIMRLFTEAQMVENTLAIYAQLVGS